jgi:hypothetical protein
MSFYSHPILWAIAFAYYTFSLLRLLAVLDHIHPAATMPAQLLGTALSVREELFQAAS